MPKKETLEHKLNHLPGRPGIYLFLDKGKQVIYVGKAKRLNSRVRSYFHQSTQHTGKNRALIRNIDDIEIIVTDSEAEALILENNLIKEHKPRYNILFRDDKTYPYICVTAEERPRIFPTRVIIRNGSRYYGPYSYVGMMKNMLETIRKAFSMCSCACSSRVLDPSRGMPKWGKCFEDYFEKCSEDIPLDEYVDKIQQVHRLLSGKTASLIRELKEEMQFQSDRLEYEKAALTRDRILALEKHTEKMKVVSEDALDKDIFAIESDEHHKTACGVLFQIREGKLIGKYHRVLSQPDVTDKRLILQSFIEDYYTGEHAYLIPDQVFCSTELPDDEPLLEYLWQMKKKKVPILVPKIGEKAQLVHMAQSNARLLLKEKIIEKMKSEQGRIPSAVLALQKELSLIQPPRRMDCFDISTFQGAHTVASLVSFVDGKPKKSQYKHYKITSVSGPDDFASMREVVERRYRRLKKEGGQVPDLIIIDGGKGQLSSAVESLKKAGYDATIPVIGLAKRLEEVFFPGSRDPLTIPKSSSALKLLQRIRDEAHRFAITYHRDVRSRETIRTQLTEIPGIGKKKAQLLLKTFGSAKKVLEQQPSELERVVGKKAAEEIVRYNFNAPEASNEVENEQNVL
ncbi:excinuclease ABC subunit UvrC [Balneolaceae bacterium ANBcel3]|nr:excinuclease ABC subunit UvrC [Balneolaceae bacterium ANBcel3]